ncbi:MAG TPA: IPT/TIG domain-containing protein [Polyangiaceae bacterium]
MNQARGWLATGVVSLFASGAIAASACGGKLLPILDTDAADAGDAAPDYGDGGPFVTRVTPDSGPNSGGTQVTIDGYGFAPGQSAVAFAGFPAKASCASSTQCTAVSPYAGHQGYDQHVHVQVTVPASDGGQSMSPATPLDVFTYTAGPQCDVNLSCAGETYYPDMVITCPTVVTFYSQYEYQLTDVITRAATYKTGTEDFPIQIVACYGDSTSTSCTTYVSVSTPFDCASPASICAYCKKLGGKCTEGPNPTCTGSIGRDAGPT